MSDQSLGGISYEVDLDASAMLSAAKEAKSSLDGISQQASKTARGLTSLEREVNSISKSSSQAANSTQAVASSMETLNTNVSAVAAGIQQAVAVQNLQSISLAQLNAGMNSLIAASKSMAEAMQAASASTTSSTQGYSRAESVMESLGNQIAILEEANENGARSAAILAAQLRLGSDASDEEKASIAQLTGQLYDMKNGADTGGKSMGAWKGKMQQAGYQVQDFIVQVQGGQSAIVAFSEQGSQLAGAFGPTGAIVGAIIALGSVIVGTLIKSMGSAEDTMKNLEAATTSLNQVISISQNGVAALSDKYALLSKANGEAATILRNQAMIEYNQAVAKLPDAINDAATSVFGLGDSVQAAMSGATVSVAAFDSVLKANNIQTNNVADAFNQLMNAGQATQGSVLNFSATIGALSSNFGITEQQAYSMLKQLNEISQTKSPEKLQELILQLQGIKSSSDDGQVTLTAFIRKLVDLNTASVNAKANMAALKGEMDNLTAGQKTAIQQSERQLALSKLTGAARAKLQAQYAAEDAGFAANDPHVAQMENDAVATYNNTQAQQALQKQQNKGKSAAEQLAKAEQSVAQKLDQMKQQSDLNAVSSQDLTLEQAKLRAEMSLGKNATAAQRAEAAKYATTIWQQAAALKARSLIPEVAENDDYSKKQGQLDMLKGQTDSQGQLLISQKEYEYQSEQLAQQHQVNLAKIAAQKSANVTPIQQAQGEIDPVQQLANQHAQQLALISQFEAQKGVLTQNGLMLQDAENTAYEKKRTDAMWALYTQQSQGYEALGAAVDGFGQSAGSALTGVITGSESASDALKNIANSVLSSVVQSFVDMGIQWVKSSIMGEAANTAAVASTTAAQVAGTATATAASTTAAATTTAAWLPAAMVASIGSLGTAAVIGVGALVSAFALSKAMSGKRQNGGPVTSGGMYQVGESNKPEIYQASNGSQYMIPGDNGKVISNSKIGSGASSSPIINVHNYNGSGVDAQSRKNSDGQDVIDLILSDQANGGPISRGFEAKYGVTNKATGDL